MSLVCTECMTATACDHILTLPACASCDKAPPEVRLKRCAKCFSTVYCSRVCQKADWKVHKKSCSKLASITAIRAVNLSPRQGLEQGIPFPYAALDSRTWLHNRPKMDVYRLLIDAYRLRIEDMRNLGGKADADSIYGGAADGLQGFRRFLGRVQCRADLLPRWWNESKKRDCEALGLTSAQWYHLDKAVTEDDMVQRYGEYQFPIQLRLFAESVYGRAPNGIDRTGVRKVMVALEGILTRDKVCMME
ncbi:hypothetical protein RJ55_06014 [Drechmeria coniospora]|nr:hypothetical protein RJ55_06014 [Drechmeria coniospora]